MDTLGNLLTEKEKLELQIDSLNERLACIESDIERMFIKKYAEEYEESLRKINPCMWFRINFESEQYEYIHIAKVLSADDRIRVSIDCRVSFGYDDYTKVSVDEGEVKKSYTDDSFIPAAVDDIQADMIKTLQQEIENMNKYNNKNE